MRRIDLSLKGNFKQYNRICSPPTRLNAVNFIFVLFWGGVASNASGYQPTGIWGTILSIYGGIWWSLGSMVGGYIGGKPSNRSVSSGRPPDIKRNGQFVNTRHSSDPVRVVYGIVKTGGTWIYNKISREENGVLNTVITWGEGEITGIGTGIDQFPIFSGTTTLNDLHTGGEFAPA